MIQLKISFADVVVDMHLYMMDRYALIHDG